MQVGQSAGGGQGQFDHALDGDGVAVQVVEQGAVFVVVRHQPQLGPGAVIFANGEGVENERRTYNFGQ